MKKVVDASALRSSTLADYLRQTAGNQIVVTDYAAMESFQGDGEINIRRSLEILAQFPKQVIVLRATHEIASLRPKARGLQARLVDEAQTAGFARYCRDLYGGNVDRRDTRRDVWLKQAQAELHFRRITARAERMRAGMEIMFRQYSAADLKALRTHQPISEKFADHIVHDILAATAILFRDSVGRPVDRPLALEIIHSFQFRFALCTYLLALKWAGDGGYQTVPVHRLKNDFTDMTYAAYATFFDGLITEDKKLAEIHRSAIWMLREVFC